MVFKRSKYCIGKLTGDMTNYIIGRIKVINVERESPDQPLNGFNTSRSPFGNGHIMALQLSGPDERWNIVPQWRQWQQTGMWRKGEVECKKFNNHILLVEVAYGTGGQEDLERRKEEYLKDPFKPDWNDKRMPAKFDVFIFPPDATFNPECMKDNEVEEYRNSLLAKKSTSLLLHPYNSYDHLKMPTEDTQWFKDNIAQYALIEAFKSQPTLKRSNSLASFAMHPDTRSEIQEKLKDYGGFSQTDIAGFNMATAVAYVADFGTEANKKKNLLERKTRLSVKNIIFSKDDEIESASWIKSKKARDEALKKARAL